MQSARSNVVQGKKGTAALKTQLAFRCPRELHERLSKRAVDGQLTVVVLRSLMNEMDLEDEAGERLRELQAAALLRGQSFGAAVAQLALEGLNAPKAKKK